MIFIDKEYYEGLKDIILKQYQGDATWNDVVQYRESYGIKTTYDYVQRGSTILMELLRAGYILQSPELDENEDLKPVNSEGVSYNPDGTFVYKKLISIADLNSVTPEIIMEKHGLNPEVWECIGYTTNLWSNGSKNDKGEREACYQSKIKVKPKNMSGLTLQDIEDYFESKQWKTRDYVEPIIVDDSEEYLEIDYADNHIGLLTWREEIGDGCDYDIKIASQRFKNTFMDILGRCQGKKYKMINFVTLGDILHIDNMSSTTTKGTPQDSDGRITKIFAAGVDLMCDIIDMLLELKCPIKYTYTSGNHDTFSGFALAKSLQKIYEKDNRITFDISPNPQKVVMYGNTLVGLTHGDMKSKNLGEWLQRSFRKEYGQCKFAEVHCGHLHTESVYATAGVIVRRLPTICESSLWEHKEGYDSQKGVMCFVYHEKLGLRETWNTYL